MARDRQGRDTAPGGPPREAGVAPVLPDELIKGHWHRRLVLPNGRGELRLTPVKPVRGRETATADAADTQDLDEHRRHSA